VSAEKPPKHVWLIGFSGSGKSTVGPKLAKLLKMRFVDTDAEIERIAACSITAMFQRHGEKRFRAMETSLIQKMAKSPRATVIAVGGGAFQSPENRAAMQQSGHTVYLKASVRVIYQRLSRQTDRPLLQVRPRKNETVRTARLSRITTMLNKRERHYRKADFVVSTSQGSPTQIARLISQKVRGTRG
jgi:shikimate kinase